ncbi:family 16 glycosylhydrolase [Clostridium sp.]|uniref:glycoside hydrolase family 16 protein n=1 Tax=Clostridium sp. TaxID=1506 RepID=UPI002846C806|nr:family 16 glycosylhydrolase [Clostridium sp.]MDR3596398.1 family 16 glycosylhydrolase [Clostridium sp.]
MKISKLTSIITSIILLCNTTLLSLLANATTIQNSDKWDLTWSDEFDGNEINTSNWTYDIAAHGLGNNELEYYTNSPENSRVENGNLVIEARKESYGGCDYTSARLKTQGLQNFLYGKIEARIKLPEDQGLWPAFWILGSNMAAIDWPDCGELDIMEHINYDEYIWGTLHWRTADGMQSEGSKLKIDVTQYHNYSIEWSPESIKWFVDDTQYFEYNIKNGNNGTTPFQKPFFIVLNLAVGGNWPKSPDSSTKFPAKMYVDYVRVYNKHSDDSSNIKGRNTWYKDEKTGSWYYLDGDGNPFKGWLYTKDYWYYLDSNGQRKTGWVNDNGNWYYLNDDGIMLKNTTIDGYYLDSNGAWVNS